MTTHQDPNATVAYDVVSAPVSTPAPADNVPNELLADDAPTGETAETTPADNRPMSDKEKMKVGGMAAAAGASVGFAGTAAAMTYGADMLHSIEEAGTNALHSVENFLGINTEPAKPAPPAPEPPHGPDNGTHASDNDPNAPSHHQNHATPPEAHHSPVPEPPHGPENGTAGPGTDPHAPDNSDNQHTTTPPQQPQADSHLVDLNDDGKADAAMIVDDHGNPEMIIDMDHDGVIDGVVIDGDHDGHLDTVITDSDHDGYADSAQIDTDHDGTPDMVLVDSDSDHGLDTAVVDSNHDGHFTADDTAQATGQDPVIAFTDHQQEGNTPPEGTVAHNDQGAHDNYDNHGDVHEWA